MKKIFITRKTQAQVDKIAENYALLQSGPHQTLVQKLMSVVLVEVPKRLNVTAVALPNQSKNKIRLTY